jgi:hypothetical protein
VYVGERGEGGEFGYLVLLYFVVWEFLNERTSYSLCRDGGQITYAKNTLGTTSDRCCMGGGKGEYIDCRNVFLDVERGHFVIRNVNLRGTRWYRRTGAK